MDRVRGKDHSYRRSASGSPDNRKNSRSRSKSRSPYFRRSNNHKSYHHSGKKGHYYEHSEDRSRGSDYDSDRDYQRREKDSSAENRSWSRSPEYQRERDRDRRYRNRKKEKSHHKSSRRSRSDSWWEKKNDDEYGGDRGSYRDDNSDGERSPSASVLGASGSEIIGYKSQPPNNTIMIRGLAQHITENDIRQDIILCGLMPKDIRLIRKKDTGASRGFAFVEFSTLNEATRWMDMKHGILILHDQYRAIMQYSIPKDLSAGGDKPAAHKASSDWFCIKCGAQNFKRRDNCFKCHASRMESEEGGSGSDEVCTYATKTIMLRNLDALTTEDSVLTALKNVVPDMSMIHSISAVTIGRDPLTSTSRGICYLGLDSTIDSLTLYNALNSLTGPLMIDGKSAILSFCKYQMGDPRKAYSDANNVAFPNASVPSTYAMADVESLAEYAATRYAKTPDEYMHFLMYYRDYFTQQINAGNTITLHQDNQMDAANAAAAVAQSAIQQRNASKSMHDRGMQIQIPNGLDGKIYPTPDITKFVIDKTSNYYYDPNTGLYYDPGTGYYWNPQHQVYLYFDQEQYTYVRVNTSYTESYNSHEQMSSSTYSNNASVTSQITDKKEDVTETKKVKSEKQDKVKVAKKIQKDMERWAKTLNQKKEIGIAKAFNEFHYTKDNSASADIGFAVLEKKASSNNIMQKDVPDELPIMQGHPEPLVAAYGESESSGDEEHPVIDENDLLDFKKLICNLCKRQLSSAEALSKHAQLSALHKQNLEMLQSKYKKNDNNDKQPIYRDRAKERRMKYGNPDEPQPSKLKEKFLKSRELVEAPVSASVIEPIGVENVGNRLLQKMGWTEGQGLGKTNQGRTSIIVAEQRSSTVGLGNKASYTQIAGESYKDCVKKTMYARYQELTEKENAL